MIYITNSLYTFPKKYLHSAVKNYKLLKTREERMQSLSPDGFGFVVFLFVFLRKHESLIVAFRDLAKLLTELSRDWVSEDFKTVLDVSPRKCHKPVHCFFIVLPIRENARNLFLLFLSFCHSDKNASQTTIHFGQKEKDRVNAHKKIKL